MPLYVHALGTNYVSAAGLGQLTGRAFSEGVIGANDLVVSEKGTGTNMSVDVSTGALILHSTTGYGHILFATDITNVPLAAADPLNPRKSLIVAVLDTDYTNSTANDAEGGWSIIEVAGAAAAVPAEPDDTAIQTAAGAGNLYEVIGLVDVPANASEITDEDITDRRELSNLQLPTAYDLLPDGSVVQVVDFHTGAVATGSTVMLATDSPPQNTQGDQYMSVSITPKSATNKLKIEVVSHLSSSSGDKTIVGALFKDSDVNALAAVWNRAVTTANIPVPISFTHNMVAGTTSPITFKFRAGGNTTTLTFNGTAGNRLFGGVFASSIVITEIKA